LQKADYKLRHVCPFAWNSSSPTGRVFMKFHIWGFFENLSRKFVSLQSDKHNGCVAWRPIYFFFIFIVHFFLEWEIVQKKCTENQNTYFVFNNLFFFPENRTVYEIMWKNSVERGRQQMTLWCMRIACWILKATNTHTHSDCIILNNIVYTNAPQPYIIPTLPVVFDLPEDGQFGRNVS